VCEKGVYAHATSTQSGDLPKRMSTSGRRSGRTKFREAHVHVCARKQIFVLSRHSTHVSLLHLGKAQLSAFRWHWRAHVTKVVNHCVAELKQRGLGGSSVFTANAIENHAAGARGGGCVGTADSGSDVLV
jgi:hypothetical protein